MKKFNLSSKQIITWICVNYGLFILVFLTLGSMSRIKSVIIVNFVLDVVLCAVSFVLNIMFFSTRHKTPVVGKIGLLFVTLCFAAFTYFVFLVPEGEQVIDRLNNIYDQLWDEWSSCYSN